MKIYRVFGVQERCRYADLTALYSKEPRDLALIACFRERCACVRWSDVTVITFVQQRHWQIFVEKFFSAHLLLKCWEQLCSMPGMSLLVAEL